MFFIVDENRGTLASLYMFAFKSSCLPVIWKYGKERLAYFAFVKQVFVGSAATPLQASRRKSHEWTTLMRFVKGVKHARNADCIYIGWMQNKMSEKL